MVGGTCISSCLTAPALMLVSSLVREKTICPAIPRRLVLGVVRMVLYLIVGFFVIFTFVHKMPILLLYGVSIFILAQLVRIAQIEVEHMEDRGYLMAISRTIIAIASLVVAILSEFEVI